MCGSEKVTLGHEFAGTVVSKGPMAGDKFSVGDQVGVDPNLPCHRCQFCVRGQVSTNHSAVSMSRDWLSSNHRSTFVKTEEREMRAEFSGMVEQESMSV